MRTFASLAFAGAVAVSGASIAQSPTTPADAAAINTATPTGAAARPQLNAVRVELAATQGHRAGGRLLLSPDNLGLYITGTVTGLKANSAHGFHVHAQGDCSAADASSAGDHFNPDSSAHGNPNGASHHAGDLPNATADAQGAATINLHLKGLTLGDGGINDVLGKAIIVHADPDDYSSQPAGNAGARIACGVIAPEPAVAAADSPAN